jgi:hypothetical protein
MPVKQTQKLCKTCQKRTLHQKNQFSGGMGCLLTILTVGLFLPIWLLADVLDILSPYRCQTCGQKN